MNQYDNIIDIYLKNSIYYISDIIKVLGKTLSELSEYTGYNASTYSRNKKNVTSSDFKRESNLPYAITLLYGIDSILFSTDYSPVQLGQIETFLFNGIEKTDTSEADNIFFIKEAAPVTLTQKFSWYSIDIKNHKGFVYQLSYLKQLSIGEQNALNQCAFKNSLTDLINQLNDVYITSPVLSSSFYIQRLLDSINNFMNKKMTFFTSEIVRKYIYLCDNNTLENEIKNITFLPNKARDIPKLQESSDLVQEIITFWSYSKNTDSSKNKSINNDQSNNNNSHFMLLVSSKEEIDKIEAIFLPEITDKIIFVYFMPGHDAIILHHKGISITEPLTAIGAYNLLTN